jgi:hypothetical protein
MAAPAMAAPPPPAVAAMRPPNAAPPRPPMAVLGFSSIVVHPVVATTARSNTATPWMSRLGMSFSLREGPASRIPFDWSRLQLITDPVQSDGSPG